MISKLGKLRKQIYTPVLFQSVRISYSLYKPLSLCSCFTLEEFMTCWCIEVYPQVLCLRLDPMFDNARLHENLNCVIQLVLGKFSFTSHLVSLPGLYRALRITQKSGVSLAIISGTLFLRLSSHPIYTVEASSITQLSPP